MTSIVTISAPSQSVKASKEGLAEHAFSITNITAGRLALGTKILADAPAEESWFTIEGAAKRELAPNETDQVVVKVKLPADGRPGEYKFSLQVYSTERGRAGEDFTNGPTVAVEMPEPSVGPIPVVPKGSGGFKWWMAALPAAIVLVVGGGIAWYLWSNDEEEKPDVVNVMPVEVPNVVRLPLEAAEQKLTAAGLKVQKNPPVGTLEFKAGEVTQQIPEAFSNVEPGSVVSLWFAGESVKVPSVKEDTLQAAISKMTAAKLVVKQVTGDPDKVNQRVVSTTPAEEQVVLAGSEVTIHMPGQVIAIPVLKFPTDLMLQLKTNRGIE